MVKVLFKRLNQKAKLPSYKTDGSSGMDLMACLNEPITIKPNESKLIPTGIAIPVGINLDSFGLIVIGSFKHAIRSIPEDPSVL